MVRRYRKRLQAVSIRLFGYTILYMAVDPRKQIRAVLMRIRSSECKEKWRRYLFGRLRFGLKFQEPTITTPASRLLTSSLGASRLEPAAEPEPARH